MSNKDTLLHAAALLNAGDWSEAERICLQALHGQQRGYGQQRDYADVMHELGVLSEQYGELTLAMGFLEKAIARSPRNARYYADLGDLLARQRRFNEAIAIFDQALGIKPDFAQVHALRGRALLATGSVDAAAAAYEQALRIEPDLADAHFGLGTVFQIRGQADKAMARYDRALRIKPDFAKAHNNRGTIVMQRGLMRDALEAFDKAIHIQSDFVEAYNNRGNVFLGLGRFDRAVPDFRKAVELRPDYSEAWNNMLFGLNYDPAVDQKQLVGEHRAWAARFGRVPAPTSKPHKNLPDPERLLRLGYVSADFGHHPVGFFSLPVLAAHDRERFEVYCYSNRPVCNEDDLTARFKTHASVWRCTVGVPDAALGEQIRADGIDILVDLSGHTAGNRLTMFALKPAPLQVHWAGYCHTTALPAMDYAVWDAIQVPAGEERWFTETIVRLPDARWCYAPPDYAPEVAEPPVLKRGYTTFGSFNNLAKLNKAVIGLWASVLRAVPNSRLMLNWRTLADPYERERVHVAFAAHGIPSDRLILTRGAPEHRDLLGEYGEVDIALDPFPFSGCTSSFELLWMGVPVVTLPRERPVSRQTQSFLTVLKRDEWIAKDEQDYIRIAAELAADPNRLARLREVQRMHMAASPLCDGPRFTRHFEAALRAMWGNWCEVQPKGIEKWARDNDIRDLVSDYYAQKGR